MKKTKLLLVACISLTLAACNNESSTSVVQTTAKPDTASATTDKGNSNDNSPVLATVNGKPISQQTLDFHMQQRNLRRPGNSQEEDQSKILEEIVSLELMQQAAVDQGIDKRPDIAMQLEHQRRAFLAGVAVQEFVANNPASEADTKAIYDERFGAAGKEYKARHILLKTEEEAKNIIGELDKGGDFAELAKEHSTGPTGPNGGDLGWFSPSQMVAPFSEAVAKLENGQYAKEPVKTQFGWHVISLEDSRDATPPAYDDVKDQLEMMVQNQKLQDYLQQMRSSANVQIK